MMARSDAAPFKGRIQKRKTNRLQIINSSLQRTAGPYKRAHGFVRMGVAFDWVAYAPCRSVLGWQVPLCELDLTGGKLSPILNDAALRQLIDDLAGFVTCRVNRQPDCFWLVHISDPFGQIPRAKQHVQLLGRPLRSPSDCRDGGERLP
jgi:hypothetical protein